MRTIEEVIEYAENNKFSKPIMLAMHNAFKNGKQVEAIGDNPNYSCEIDGMRIVFSIEEHSCGWGKHISISTKNGLPSVTKTEEIMKKFDMKLDENSHVYVEDSVPKAINIICKI